MYRTLPEYEDYDVIHIWNRCHNKDWFQIEMDIVWEIFTRNLYFISYSYGIKINAFVLMSNHYHLLVTDPNKNLSEAIGYFQRLCTLEINKLSGRINTMWGGRFGRSLIGSYDYMLVAYKYVYRNPVEAGLCDKVEAYPWSSLRFLIGDSKYEFPVYDDLINPINFRRELRWLNDSPSEDKIESVRKALKRKKFKLPKVSKRQNPIDYEGY